MKNALKFISKKKLGVLVARNHRKKTTGIITDGQIRRKSEKKGNLQHLRVKDVMTKKLIFCNKYTSSKELMELMSENKIRHIPILEQYTNQ